jgi:hypothetical protein
VNTLESTSFNGFWPNFHWPMTLKMNRVPDSPKDYVCTKFGQNPLKDVDSRVFTRMLCGKNLTRWPWPLTLKIDRVPDSRKNILVNTRINILQWILTKLGTYLDLKRIWNPIDFQGQRSRSQGLIFRRGDTPRFALPLLLVIFDERNIKYYAKNIFLIFFMYFQKRETIF